MFKESKLVEKQLLFYKSNFLPVEFHKLGAGEFRCQSKGGQLLGHKSGAALPFFVSS